MMFLLVKDTLPIPKVMPTITDMGMDMDIIRKKATNQNRLQREQRRLRKILLWNYYQKQKFGKKDASIKDASFFSLQSFQKLQYSLGCHLHDQLFLLQKNLFLHRQIPFRTPPQLSCLFSHQP